MRIKPLMLNLLSKTDKYKLGRFTQANAMTIFSFMTFNELVDKVSKICKKINKWLIKPNL